MNENINNCFTEIEDGKVNAKFNKTTMKCFDSENNKFSMDCEGNLVVNSIITREQSGIGLTFDQVYPVGSIYMSVSSIDPSTLFGGVWEQIQDRFLLASGSTYTNGTMGGEATHTLQVNEMPQHNHNHYEWMFNGANASGVHYGVAWKSGDGGLFKAPSVNSNATFPFGNEATGGSQAHNNMPPYLVVYIWKRIS